MNFLVTGASGFIGKKLVNAIEGGVTLLSRNNNPLYPTVICDLEKDKIPSHTCESIDVVMHLAGLSHDMRDANKIEDLYYDINVNATIQLAKLAAQSGVRQFIFVSSTKAGGYSTSEGGDSSEPEGVYGRSKRKAELELLKIGKESDMSVSIIRPSLVYGPDLKGNLKLMLTGVEKNWFPPLPEIENQRSMIHVDDLVRAILLLVDNSCADQEIFIATDGVTYSSRDIYNIMRTSLGKSIPNWSVPKILFDIAQLASPRIKFKINKLLGDEYYSSDKLEALGFKARKTLKDMNETDF